MCKGQLSEEQQRKKDAGKNENYRMPIAMAQLNELQEKSLEEMRKLCVINMEKIIAVALIF